jgi:hypothetical protein
VQKVLSNGKIVEVEPGIKDRAALAGYARTAGEIAFRALGDIPLARAKESVPAQAALVEIHLPAAIALPRQLRGEPQTQTLTLPNEQSKVLPVTPSPAADEAPAHPLSSESV